MTLSQIEIDTFLDRQNNVPIFEHPQYPVPRTNHEYTKLLAMFRSGFVFSNRDLLHAIGCKTAALPMNDQDEAIRSAYVFLHLLDIDAPTLRFRDVHIDSDLARVRSQQIGIGMMCLIASRAFGVDWDQLSDIPAPGKRFDYRGPIPGNKRGIFEAKGTGDPYHQGSQILDGREKKEAHHKRNEHYDVELIVATYVGVGDDNPRIIVADPQFSINESMFGPRAEKYYRLRHFTRVLQFLALPSLSRLYYAHANEVLRGWPSMYRRLPPQLPTLEMLRIDKTEFVGRWFDRWLPPDSFRYKRLYERERTLLTSELNFRSFQGIARSSFDYLLKESPEEIKFMSWEECQKYKGINGGTRASVFPDTTVLAFEVI